MEKAKNLGTRWLACRKASPSLSLIHTRREMQLEQAAPRQEGDNAMMVCSSPCLTLAASTGSLPSKRGAMLVPQRPTPFQEGIGRSICSEQGSSSTSSARTPLAVVTPKVKMRTTMSGCLDPHCLIGGPALDALGKITCFPEEKKKECACPIDLLGIGRLVSCLAAAEPGGKAPRLRRKYLLQTRSGRWLVLGRGPWLSQLRAAVLCGVHHASAPSMHRIQGRFLCRLEARGIEIEDKFGHRLA